MSKLAALVFVVTALQCSSKEADCDLGAQLGSRAGAGATDCGHAVSGGDAKPVDDCVVAAFNAGTAFVAQYDRNGVDSKTVFGVAGDASGKITFLTWDGDPSGGSGAHPVITGTSCLGPSVDTSASRDPFVKAPFDCASDESLGTTCG